MQLGYIIPRNITIRASANMGFIVEVGCAKLVAPDTRALLNGLEEYLEDPRKWEEDYNKMPCREVMIDREPPHPRGVLVEARGSNTEDESSAS